MITDRAGLAQAFLDGAGWAAAPRTPVAGDASARRYDRLQLGPQTAILMDAPPERGETIQTFVRVARWLLAQGLSAPAILAEDPPHGFLLIEDLGDALFARLVADTPSRELSLYSAATDLLIDLHRHDVPDWLATYDPATLGTMVTVATEWYLPAFGTRPDQIPDLVGPVTEAALRLLGGPSVVCLRDYHAENLIWLPKRAGVARVGLLDFQDAFAGHPAYDLVSLLQDARRDVPAAIETAMLARYCAANRQDETRFQAAYALLGVQRNLRILGVFTRLALHLGKRRYLALIPRVWGNVQRNLAHPELTQLARAVSQGLPAPQPETLRKIAARCPAPSP